MKNYVTLFWPNTIVWSFFHLMGFTCKVFNDQFSVTYHKTQLSIWNFNGVVPLMVLLYQPAQNFWIRIDTNQFDRNMLHSFPNFWHTSEIKAAGYDFWQTLHHVYLSQDKIYFFYQNHNLGKIYYILKYTKLFLRSNCWQF